MLYFEYSMLIILRHSQAQPFCTVSRKTTQVERVRKWFENTFDQKLDQNVAVPNVDYTLQQSYQAYYCLYTSRLGDFLQAPQYTLTSRSTFNVLKNHPLRLLQANYIIVNRVNLYDTLTTRLPTLTLIRLIASKYKILFE